MLKTKLYIQEMIVLNKQILTKMFVGKMAQVGGTVNKFTNFIIGIAVLFFVAAALVPEAQTAGNSLNASGLPLGTLFVSGGVVFILIAVALLNAAIKGPGK
ncbi:hypothetical protein LCGC14_1065170 [marine sediment metagenome]|uniref:Uncharacterized protein n=1 Tax=marine sediment metagenome TaxID=412755 RepID=A0A0F9MJV7_9ZZZZ